MQKCFGVELQKSTYVPTEQRLPMHGSSALGATLVSDGKFAADMLWFESEQSTEMHTHLGDHILYVTWGNGWLIFDGEEHKLCPGNCYFVPGGVPHRVGTKFGMHLLSVSNDHRPIDSFERSQIV